MLLLFVLVVFAFGHSFLPYFVSCCGPRAPKEKLHRKKKLIIMVIIIIDADEDITKKIHFSFRLVRESAAHHSKYCHYSGVH